MINDIKHIFMSFLEKCLGPLPIFYLGHLSDACLKSWVPDVGFRHSAFQGEVWNCKFPPGCGLPNSRGGDCGEIVVSYLSVAVHSS